MRIERKMEILGIGVELGSHNQQNKNSGQQNGKQNE